MSDKKKFMKKEAAEKVLKKTEEAPKKRTAEEVRTAMYGKKGK